MGELERDDQTRAAAAAAIQGVVAGDSDNSYIVPTAVDRCLTGGRRGQEVVGITQVGEFQQSSSCKQRWIAPPMAPKVSRESYSLASKGTTLDPPGSMQGSRAVWREAKAEPGAQRLC